MIGCSGWPSSVLMPFEVVWIWCCCTIVWDTHADTFLPTTSWKERQRSKLSLDTILLVFPRFEPTKHTRFVTRRIRC